MIKTFVTNRCHVNGEEIILQTDNEIISDSSVLGDVQLTLNKYYRQDMQTKT